LGIKIAAAASTQRCFGTCSKLPDPDLQIKADCQRRCNAKSTFTTGNPVGRQARLERLWLKHKTIANETTKVLEPHSSHPKFAAEVLN
jgi:hypothetical protein